MRVDGPYEYGEAAHQPHIGWHQRGAQIKDINPQALWRLAGGSEGVRALSGQNLRSDTLALCQFQVTCEGGQMRLGRTNNA